MINNVNSSQSAMLQSSSPLNNAKAESKGEKSPVAGDTFSATKYKDDGSTIGNALKKVASFVGRAALTLAPMAAGGAVGFGLASLLGGGSVACSVATTAATFAAAPLSISLGAFAFMDEILNS